MMGISGYHTWRDNGKHECKMRIIECHRDLIEYLAPLPPEGSQLLQIKAGEALPADGDVYCWSDDGEGWCEWTAKRIATAEFIYAHKPAIISQPQAEAFESEENKIGIIFNNADFWSIQTAMGVFEMTSGRFKLGANE
jgi:hypothetical protein